MGERAMEHRNRALKVVCTLSNSFTLCYCSFLRYYNITYSYNESSICIHTIITTYPITDTHKGAGTTVSVNR